MKDVENMVLTNKDNASSIVDRGHGLVRRTRKTSRCIWKVRFEDLADS